MITDPLAQQLIFFICLLATTATLAWGAMAYPLRIAPRASGYFSVANLFLLIGVILTSQRSSDPSYLYWPIANIMILMGFLLLRHGTQRLFRLKSSIKTDCVLLTVFTVLIALQEPGPQSNQIVGILFSSMAALSFLLLAKDNRIALAPSLNLTFILLLLSPIIVLAFIFTLRTLLLLFAPSLGSHMANLQSADAIPMLWFFVMMTLLVNVVMIGNALTRLVQKIRLQADKDYLTGLWNRRAMHQRLALLHQCWLRDGKTYSLILFDLDYFKEINDNYSHAAGDHVLIQTATELSKVIRAIDTFSRYGGEEFLIILPATDAQQVAIITDKLRSKLNSSPVIWQDNAIPITASFGTATVSQLDTPETMLIKADKAMYRAKHTGRNNICSAT
ncbi:GGDEF domain-containing protein [Shewanella psychrotolerans]|uniref:GGDEF domain-containing protein n=1 Tax=Shewanella psychrotolerans TaxID=2864206 RepID=UPI001C65580E|nr:GGDEF domain-containing protein [Shewanella psychrotolerans]QYK01033.1 GGDEF domain-containing protein [Shewanella psychrotolerans]